MSPGTLNKYSRAITEGAHRAETEASPYRTGYMYGAIRFGKQAAETALEELLALPVRKWRTPTSNGRFDVQSHFTFAIRFYLEFWSFPVAEVFVVIVELLWEFHVPVAIGEPFHCLVESHAIKTPP